MADKTLAFNILARDKATKPINDVAGALDKASAKSHAFNKAAGAAAVGGLAILGGVLKTGIDEVKDYQAGLAQADAVIKSTGGSAGVSSKHVEDLASSIQSYSGQTDDAIVAGENMLLTFTNIKNAAGKGNDVFDQTTKILADMSQAMGQDTKTTAIQLGKALNDPVKGMTALQKVGVTFTAQQKAVNKALVDGGVVNALNASGFNVSTKSLERDAKTQKKSVDQVVDAMVNSLTPAQQKLYAKYQEGGHVMDAQKNILAELTKEFGGSAKAFGDSGPGQIEKAHRAFEDVSQTLVTKLLPALTSTISFVTKNSAVIVPLVTVLGTMAAAFFLVNKAMTAGAAVKAAYLAITGSQTVATEAATVAQTELDVAMDANPIGLVIAAVAGLAAGFVYLYKHSKTVRDGIDGLWSILKTTFNWVKDHWQLILGILTGPIGGAVILIVKYRDKIWGAFKALPGLIGKALSGLKAIVLAPFQGIIDAYNDTVGRIPGGPGPVGGSATAKKLDPTVAHRLVPTSGKGGGGTVVPGQGRHGQDIHVHVHVDGKEVAHVVNKHNNGITSRGGKVGFAGG